MQVWECTPCPEEKPPTKLEVIETSYSKRPKILPNLISRIAGKGFPRGTEGIVEYNKRYTGMFTCTDSSLITGLGPILISCSQRGYRGPSASCITFGTIWTLRWRSSPNNS